MAFTTWSTTDSTNITLSGGNLIATASASVAGVRGAHPKRAGLVYWETTCTTWLATGLVGASWGGSPVTPSASIIGVGVQKSAGAIVLNSSGSGFSLGARANGDIIGHALDLTTGKYWARVCPAGNWNGQASDNPATGVGGVSLVTALGVPPAFDLYPFAFLNATPGAITGNFGATAFSGVVPVGYASGWDDSVAVVTNVIATQLGVEAWAYATPTVRLTQIGIEAWAQVTPANVIATQVGLEAWVSVRSVPQGGPIISLIM